MMDRFQLLGAGFLTLFCLSTWLAPRWIAKDPKSKPSAVFSMMEPLTIPERILLGYVIPIGSFAQKDWESFPAIGPGLARRIVTHQEKYGPFRKVEALLDVDGIGEKTLESLRPFLKDSWSTR